MEAMELKRLPVGIQTYEKLVDNNCLYVDKTQYIYKMIKLGNYIFLSRPRRFGKSLLVSTLAAYFEGKKHLFKGTFIDGVEKDWTEYPVLRFDMSLAKHQSKEDLPRYLLYIIESNERKFGLTSDLTDPNLRLTNLIQRAYEQTGKQVVVLIDEYDAPLLDVAHEKTQLDDLRQIMRNFYSPLKACDKYLKFVFITGITKFSQLSIFSELNNLNNISMQEQFAAVCGITVEEVQTQMSDYIDRLAQKYEQTPEDVFNELKKKYDGYHFTWPSPDIFNPFSIMLAFANNNIQSYWFESGTPTFLIEMMRKFNVTPSDIEGKAVMASAFDAPTENMKSITPLLYQSGYLTIKGYNRMANIYTLDIPNNEIRIGLMESLLPNYVNISWENGLTTIAYMFMALYNDDLNEMLRLLQTYLLTIPQCDNTNYEGHYQQMLYVIFSLLGRYVDVEVRTPKGRVDMVMNSGKALYLFELKLNKSAEAAMNQINL
ncbi:MAG: AAA family ATPase, partial [Candidatus Limisoma sp.]|nr:AAA family ATPase [Candidatus Limisoma sp.]